MAAPNRIYALDIGTQTITLAEFQPNPNGGVTLVRYKKGEILGDPGADATRITQTKLQIAELAQEFGLKGAKVNYAIASHVIFTRPVRLPSVGEAGQVEQIVGFEAAQNVPYPIDQVVWDWQLLDAGKGGEMEVILAAIKSDLLDELNGAVQEGHLQTGIVEIAPMALYNALRYNYYDAEGCSLLVDIGSRTTNLLFCEPGKIFPRRLNIGGSTVTTAIGKDLNVSYPEADTRKAQDGFVSLGGTYAEPDDEEVARISKIIRNQMTRLHQEIARSITFYRSEHAGSAPQRVLIAGGTASLPYMREFFQEKFPGLDVEYFNPLRNVAVSSSLDLDEVGRDAHTLGEVIGLGLRAVGSCPMELNLRPVSVVKAERIASQRPFMIAAGVLVLAGLAAMWQYNARAASETSAVTEKVEAKIAPLKNMESRINSANSDIRSVQDSTKSLIKTVHEREYWATIIADLNKRLPQDYIWITSFEPPTKEALQTQRDAAAKAAAPTRPGDKKKKNDDERPVIVMVKGLYLSVDAGNNGGPTTTVDQFVKNLKESELVEPINDPQGGFDVSSDNTPEWGFKYTLPIKLKNPIELK